MFQRFLTPSVSPVQRIPECHFWPTSKEASLAACNPGRPVHLQYSLNERVLDATIPKQTVNHPGRRCSLSRVRERERERESQPLVRASCSRMQAIRSTHVLGDTHQKVDGRSLEREHKTMDDSCEKASFHLNDVSLNSRAQKR